MRTHDTYTIRRGWRLKRDYKVRETEIWIDGTRQYAGRFTRGIEIARGESAGTRSESSDDRTLVTQHGHCDSYAVFAPIDYAEEQPYRIVVLFAGDYGYVAAEEHAWTVAGWVRVDEHSIFVGTDHEMEEVCGVNWFALDEATICRRILEALHDRF